MVKKDGKKMVKMMVKVLVQLAFSRRQTKKAIQTNQTKQDVTVEWIGICLNTIAILFKYNFTKLYQKKGERWE